MKNRYFEALSEINSLKIEKKIWLKQYFELYKETLIWPDDLPPINRSFLKKDPDKQNFNSVFKKILTEFDYTLDNKEKTLKL